ncbi:MAG: tetratricopeptide repeat protein [Muribaculaceae bacterium]|nr:tetratricopeptide repeat protein [Muribaculaceae bacterium]
MGKNLLRFSGIVALLLTTLSFFGIANAKKMDDSARKKARYYYVEGSRALAEGKGDAAYEYFRKALRTDPSYAEAAYNVGASRLYLRDDTLQTFTELTRSLDLMRPYVEKNPGSTAEVLSFAMAASHLDKSDESLRVLNRALELNPGKSDLLAMISDIHAGREEYREAADALERYVTLEGNSLPAAMRMMSYMLADRDTAGAVEAANKLIALNPLDPSFLVIKGNLFEVIEQPDSSFATYTYAEKIAPESGFPKLALAEFYHTRGDSVMYDEKLYEVLLSEDLQYEQKHELLAQYLQELVSGKQDTSRGDHLFSVLRERYPHRAELRDLAARYAGAKGDFNLAAEEISYAIDQDPTNQTYWGQRMTYLSSAERYDEALAVYDKALEYVEPEESLRLLRSLIAMQGGHYDIARGVYASMIQEIDSNLTTERRIELSDLKKNVTLADLDRLSQLYASIGDVYQQESKPDSAYLCYENAITLDDQNWMAMNNYAYFLTTNGGDLDKARGLAERVMSGSERHNPTFIDTYAWILHLQGEDEAALPYQLEAVEAAEESDRSDSAELYDHLADILHKLGRDEEAVENWRKALEKDPENKEEIEKKINKVSENVNHED